MAYFLAIDIGGLSVKYGVLDSDGTIYEKGSFPSEREDFTCFLIPLIKCVHEMQAKYAIEGIAISSPGAVDTEKGIVHGGSALPCIHEKAFREIFMEQCQLEIAIENDANCAALGEVWKGAAAHNNDVAFVVCGTGIGGALVKDRKIHKGTHNHGGEFGYMVASVEEKEGTFKIINWSEAASPGNMARAVSKQKGLEPESLNAKEVYALRESGDQIAKEGIETMYKELVKGIYNIQYTYDPEKIILGGAISARADLKAELDEVMARLLKATPISKVVPQIELCHYQGDANMIGALYHYLQSNDLLESGE